MERVRRTRPVAEAPVVEVKPIRFMRRTRTTTIEEVEEIGEEVEDTPDRVLEGETSQQAADRIENKYRKRAKSPLKAVRAFCVLCMGCMPREVAHCTAHDCVLYPFRFGKNPFQKRGNK